MTIITRALEALRANTVELSREEWIKEAEKAEKSGAPSTAQSRDAQVLFNFINSLISIRRIIQFQ